MEFELLQNYPNPFNPTTTIKFTIPNVGDEYIRPLQTRLIVYDILGREVATLVNTKLQSGNHEVKFDGRNLSSGVYFYKLDVDNIYSASKKMMLIK
ncbi:MAG: T9SS C-terminal target domain-containing protein [Ignavibacteriales bacterium]|nr:MAG: T9SS C-terminal target domain-containing protein [Ignavibacteriales bacterium]